jgi:hypothetical protein
MLGNIKHSTHNIFLGEQRKEERNESEGFLLQELINAPLSLRVE